MPSATAARAAVRVELIATISPDPSLRGAETGSTASASDRPIALPRALDGGDTRVLADEDPWVIQTIAAALELTVEGPGAPTNNRTRRFTEVPR